jgi:hypothetical protein
VFIDETMRIPKAYRQRKQIGVKNIGIYQVSETFKG